uniref:Uncharacterized protein n=1 Tax=Romanomermis culicivorax TaxID=13658 RepID=A0A915L808_ROMCU
MTTPLWRHSNDSGNRLAVADPPATVYSQNRTISSPSRFVSLCVSLVAYFLLMTNSSCSKWLEICSLAPEGKDALKLINNENVKNDSRKKHNAQWVYVGDGN